MKRLSVLLMIFSVIGLLAAAPVQAHTEVDMLGTQNIPFIQTAEVGHPTTFVNMEPADYPLVMGRHDVSPDRQIGTLTGLAPFPVTSPMLNPGARWSWIPKASDRGKVYAYRCSVHPDTQRGIIVVE